MRICATVGVSNRDLPSLNITNKRPLRSFLTVGFMPGKDETPFILHQTQQNAVGVKYKVKGNLQTIFQRFVEDGKATLRFMNPPHDLIIKCSPVDLKSFLKVVKAVFCDKFSEESVNQKLSNLGCVPKKVPTKPKTKIVITSKSEYPTLEGFPRSLTILQISNAEMKKLDTRVLRLQNLRVLSLERNSLESLPQGLGLLPSLSELHLAGNNFGRSTDWSWLDQPTMRSNLLLLDLSDNQIRTIPRQIVKLKDLKSLLLNRNSITQLPNGLCHLLQLQNLEVSNNQVAWIPWSFLSLRLASLDISGNTGCPGQSPRLSRASPLYTPLSLLDSAASILALQRCRPDEEECPRCLIDYLSDGWLCDCGRGVFPPPSSPPCLFPVSNRRLARTTVYGPECLFVGFAFCSAKCSARTGNTIISF